MKKQIKDLKLWEIDFLVAKAEGLDAKIYKDDLGDSCLAKSKEGITWHTYSPTTNPTHAWPIIEREKITTKFKLPRTNWEAIMYEKNVLGYGDTSLESAMRCFVAYKFGNEVEL